MVAPPSQSGTGQKVDGISSEYESSPIYQALSSRLAKTESAIQALSNQVADLALQVKAVLPPSLAASATNTTTISVPSSSSSIAPAPTSNLIVPPEVRIQTSTPTPTATPAPTAVSKAGTSPNSSANAGTSTGATDISALTTQIAALSASVAQLQRLQSQSQLNRPPSYTTPPASATAGVVPGPAGPLTGSTGERPGPANANGFPFDRAVRAPSPAPAPAPAHTHGPSLSTPQGQGQGQRQIPHGMALGAIGMGMGMGPGGINNTGPMTAPHTHGKHINGFAMGMAANQGMPGPGAAGGGGGGGYGGIGRPSVSRSASVQAGSTSQGFHGQNGPGGGKLALGHLGMQGLSLNPLSPGIGNGMATGWPSPGPSGMVTPSVSGGLGNLGQSPANNGATTGGGGTGNNTGNGPATAGAGSAAPGAGIVITKWDHLNLKPELVRSIAKYGIGPPNKIQARVLPFMLKGSDIIAQAPPTQERIISYIIPAIQLCLTTPQPNGPYRGPFAVIITTTVDQATQAHKLIRNVGGPLGIRAALLTGVAGSPNLLNELQAVQRDSAQILIGTPAKVLEAMTVRGGLDGMGVRTLILDEVDQLIARNLFENVLNLAKVLPSPRRGNGPLTPGAPFSPGPGGNNMGMTSPYDAGRDSPFNPASKTPFPGQPSRFGPPGQPSLAPSTLGGTPAGIERQTCIFSNTIPTDVINFSQNLQVRDPVRVLVRREGSSNSQESVSSVTPGINLKHTYVYLTITGSARTEAPVDNGSGPGTIGSGRTMNASVQVNEEANKAKEYKLDMLVKMLDDYPLWQAIIYVGTYSMLEAVVLKLGGRQWETLYLTPDMPPPQRKAVLQQWQQWRHTLATNSNAIPSSPRFLVIFDVTVKPPEIPWAPLVVNFDLPRSVENYAHRAAGAVPPNNNNNARAAWGQQLMLASASGLAQTAAPGSGAGAGPGSAVAAGSGIGAGAGGAAGASANGQSTGNGAGAVGGGSGAASGVGTGPVNGVIVNFVQAAGGDVEMLRSTECAYRFKSAEIPSVFHDLFAH